MVNSYNSRNIFEHLRYREAWKTNFTDVVVSGGEKVILVQRRFGNSENKLELETLHYHNNGLLFLLFNRMFEHVDI